MIPSSSIAVLNSARRKSHCTHLVKDVVPFRRDDKIQKASSLSAMAYFRARFFPLHALRCYMFNDQPYLTGEREEEVSFALVNATQEKKEREYVLKWCPEATIIMSSVIDWMGQGERERDKRKSLPLDLPDRDNACCDDEKTSRQSLL